MEVCSSLNNHCPDSLTGVSAQLFFTLINAIIASKCSISSGKDYPPDYSTKLNDQDEFDFIVIGSGSAGSVAANKLSENGKWQILVLEAGDFPSSTTEIPSLFVSIQETKEDWQYVAESSNKACLGFKARQCKWPRGKCLGGSSSINAMLYIRGNKQDYDNWEQMGNTGWDYASVLKYFRDNEDLRAEKLVNSTKYGRKGYLPLNTYESKHPINKIIKESAATLGYPTVLEESNLGYFESLQNIHTGVRMSAAKVFLGTVKERQNLHVVPNAFVTRIVFDDKSKATGVEVSVDDKLIYVRTRKEIILSAGAVNSPQILMLSGVGPKEHLQNLGIKVVRDLKVGENLQDHVLYWGFYVALSPEAVIKSDEIDDLYQYFMYREGPVSQIGLLNLVGFINTRNDSIYGNIQLHHFLYHKNDTYLLPAVVSALGIPDDIGTIMKSINKDRPTLGIAPTLLRPKSAGRILLRSKDPQDKPIIDANYFSDPEDAQLLLEGIQFLQKQISSQPFEKYKPELIDLRIPGCEGFDFRSDDYWRCALTRLSSTTFHPVGTCKMGPESDPGAVVDSRLKVYGVKNLRVIDASIMPAIVSANTNGPSMMIGRKGAGMVVDDWTK